MDIFWRNTMVVIPWYLVAVAGSLILAVLVAAVVLIGKLRGCPRP